MFKLVSALEGVNNMYLCSLRIFPALSVRNRREDGLKLSLNGNVSEKS